MKTHELKCIPLFFQAILDGRKPFEVRRDDRGFMAGDVLHLREFVAPPGSGYTGREVKVRVTYVMDRCGLIGIDALQLGWVVMGIEIEKEEPDYEPVWVRDDEALQTILLLADGDWGLDIIESWTDEQCKEVETWASAVYFRASDNDDVVIPPRPAFLPPARVEVEE